MSSLLNLQGKQFFENIKNKIKEEFVNKKREGFVGGGGILGPNKKLNDVINSETQHTSSRVTNLNETISNYDGTYKVLQEKTDEYLNNQPEITRDMKKNYNVFINRSVNQDEIQPTNIMGCVMKNDIINNSNGFSSNGFDVAYPDNFMNYDDAQNACKLWAADSNKKYYAVSKNDENNFKCHIADQLPNKIDQYSKETKLYTVLSNTESDVNTAGLLNNGQIGIFNNNIINTLRTDLRNDSNSIDVNDMKKPRLIKIFRLHRSDQYTQENLNKSHYKGYISNGWWNSWYSSYQNNPNTNRDRTHNAWWITCHDIFKTGRMGIFYYVYYSPIEVTNAEIICITDNKGTVKINATKLTTVFTKNITLNAGKNIIEVDLINLGRRNGGNPGGFVLYLIKPNSSGTGKTVLVKTGDDGWGFTDNKISDTSKIINPKLMPNDITYPIKVLNSVPVGYDKCDRFVGGSINKQSIIASFGTNCSNTTFEPIKIRYITIMANNRNEHIQISQLVVKAFVNGNEVNVAPLGTATASSAWRGYTSLIRVPIDGKTYNIRSYPKIFHTHTWDRNKWWRLDLGQDYLVSKIIYYNRSECCKYRAKGMKMMLKTDNETQYKPIIFPNIQQNEYIFPINKNTVSIV